MMKSFHPILASLITLVCSLKAAAGPEELLEGVHHINTGGMPGGLSVFGPDAFAVIAGQQDKNTALPVMAAAQLDKGRVVAFGHDGFLAATDQLDCGKLLVNSVRWASGGKQRPRVGLVPLSIHGRAVDYLKANGMEVIPLDAPDSALDAIDVLYVNALAIDPSHVASIEKWIRNGGGMLTGVTGWGWMQLKGDNDRFQLSSQCPANQIMKTAGIMLSASTPGRTGASYAAGGDLSLLNAGKALDELLSHGKEGKVLTPGQLSQCATTLSDAIRSIPPDDTILRPRLARISSEEGRKGINPAFPLKADQYIERLLITRDIEETTAAKPEDIRPHPSSNYFPGAIRPGAERLGDQAVPIELSIPQWHGTGLYAPPGELIRITIPSGYVGKGIAVRIGCHTDSLWHHDAWKRVPEVSIRKPLREPVTTVASAFGGLIYLDIPAGGPSLKMETTISGAIRSPRFILGQSDPKTWKEHLASHPAPWGELETGKLVLTMPRAWLDGIEDPQALLGFWDQVMDAQADLSTIPRERKRPERIVPDIQIGGGYMHSGYPIMTHLDPGARASTSLEQMKQGSWGHFHELGHNHQQSDWTFDGTVEVTCNLYSLYVFEKLCGDPPGRGHEQMEPLVVAGRLKNHLSQPDKFTRWKNEPFLALIMYDQLRKEFGWETYQKVFAEYQTLTKEQRPKSDDEKRDQWMVRFSNAAGRNLGPFFEAWGVPTSEAARQSITALPEWMPAGME